MVFCHQCGKKVDDKSTYCVHCGHGIKIKPNRHVGMTEQIILASIPIIITQIFACYRIKKTKDGVLLVLLLYFVGTIATRFTVYLMPTTLSGVLATTITMVATWIIFAIILIIPIYFVHKWTKQYNSRFSESTSSNVNQTKDNTTDSSTEGNI